MTFLASAQSLEYSPTKGENYRYEIDIQLRLGTETITLAGTTNYHVDSVDDNEVMMTCVGGLQEKKTKIGQGQNRGAPDGPLDFRSIPRIEPPFPSPFGKPVFRGTTVTTNKITLTKTGELVEMVGESQLPYLLGHLSMLPFEPLPAEGEKRWVVEGTQGIQTVKSSSGIGAFTPFEDRNDRNLRAAKTMQTYELIREDDKSSTVQKTYQLTLPVKSEEAVLELSGAGQWTFDNVRKMPSSMKFTYQMKIEVGGAIVSAPMTLNYRLLSAEELAKREQIAQQEKKEAAEREHQRKLEAERPIGPAEKAKIMAGLNSQRPYDQMIALQTLGQKTPTEPDPQIVAKIRFLMDKGTDKAVTQTARRVLENWDPEFKKLISLIASYDSQMSVESTGRAVDQSTPLYPGQIVQVKEHRRWRAAEVTELLGSGRVEVKMRGPFAKLVVYPRSDIQLAPEALPQPEPPRGYRAAPKSTAQPVDAEPSPTSSADDPMNDVRTSSGELTPLREWSSASGEHRVMASLMMISESELVLKREDGKPITVALQDMSAVDQAFIEGLRLQRPQTKNPFE